MYILSPKIEVTAGNEQQPQADPRRKTNDIQILFWRNLTFPIPHAHMRLIPIVTPVAAVVCGIPWLPLVQDYGDSDHRVWRSDELGRQYLEWPFGCLGTRQWNMDDAHCSDHGAEADEKVGISRPNQRLEWTLKWRLKCRLKWGWSGG